MSKFRDKLLKFETELSDKPAWDRHLPDEIFRYLEDVDDFVFFLSFMNKNLDTDLFEYECYDTSAFLEALLRDMQDEDFANQVDKCGIHSSLGKIAYGMTLAVGAM